MNQLHVKNHYVPECYLKRWESSSKKIYVYRTLVNHQNVPIWRPHSVSAIAYQKHLYTRVIAGGESDEIETWLDREFESPANAILEKVTSDSRLSPNDWEILIKFLAAQDVRTPARLFEHLQRAQKELPEILQNILDELQEKYDQGEFDALKTKDKTQKLEPFPLKVTTHIEEGADTGILKAETYVGRSTWIHSIRHVLEKTSKILHAHTWSIVKPAKGYFWPTSDNPVVKLNYYRPGNYDLKGGWGVKKGNILFPIGPEHAMFVQIGERPILKGTRLSSAQTSEFIKIIVENAHRMVFSINENRDLPLLRKRIVDRQILERENEEMHQWHQKNSLMEREYLASNQNA